MQPSFNIARALVDNGIICDTSHAKRKYPNNESVGKIDYRSVNSDFDPEDLIYLLEAIVGS